MTKKYPGRVVAVPACLSLALGLVFGHALFSANRLMRPAGQPTDPQKNLLLEKIEKRLEARRDELIETYRDLHRHPEVSGREERTAGIIAGRLRSLGLEVRTGIGGHGVIGILKGAQPGPVVAYRADMDAVFSDEPDPVSFRSETPGVRHICGHDLHTTVALGIADALTSVREELPGTVKFIFQPAEENVQGARAMIEASALENPTPEAILAVHCAPVQVGQIAGKEGMLLAGFDLVTVTLEGEGDLKTTAQAAAKIITSVSSRNLQPPQASRSPALPEEGRAGNDFILAMITGTKEIPEKKQLVIRGLIRASSEDHFETAQSKIQSGLENLKVAGVAQRIEYVRGALPAVMNDPELVRVAADTIRSLLGGEVLVEMSTVPPYFSEDFAYYLQKIPGVMYFLGVSNEDRGIIGMPHSPQFAVDEEAIFVGARTMAVVLLGYLD